MPNNYLFYRIKYVSTGIYIILGQSEYVFLKYFLNYGGTTPTILNIQTI